MIRAYINPYPAKLFFLNFQQLEVVSRYRDPQPQVAENYSYLINLTLTNNFTFKNHNVWKKSFHSKK